VALWPVDTTCTKTVDQDGYIQTINSLKKHYIKLIQ